MIRVRLATRKTRALCFDLEARPLAFWYDGETTKQITAFGWKWSDNPHVHTMLLRPSGRYDFNGTRKRLAPENAHETFLCELERADLVYGHNIRRYDLPLFQGWLLRLGLRMMPELRTTDTCRDLPKRSSVSVSLENMAAMYRLEGEKYGMSQPMWEEANRLTDGGIALARKRVESDVLLQERLRGKLVELDILRPPRVWKP
jgi:hypothetical protein